MIEIYKHADLPTYVIADVHGDFDMLKSNIINNEAIHNCILIIAGDIGLGFYTQNYYLQIFEELNNIFIQKYINCYLIRGNHDDPKYFSEHIINFSNVKSIDDYSIISIGEENILCIGGAISIDRTYRIKNDDSRFVNNKTFMRLYNPNVTDEEVYKKTLKTYWINENVYYDEEKLNEILIENKINIDYVITHTSPDFAWKQGTDGIKYWINNDEPLEDDLRQERLNLTKVSDKLKECNQEPKKWVYGHFHNHNAEVIENTLYIALINCDYSFDCIELNKKREL